MTNTQGLEPPLPSVTVTRHDHGEDVEIVGHKRYLIRPVNSVIAADPEAAIEHHKL